MTGSYWKESNNTMPTSYSCRQPNKKQQKPSSSNSKKKMSKSSPPVTSFGSPGHQRHQQQSLDVRRQRIYYPFRVMGGLGIAQIFLGILAICMQVVAFYTSEPTSYLGAGVWGGIFFIGAGTLAYVSTRRKGGRGQVSWSISVMVVSIFAILVALGMLAVASIGLHLTSNFKYDTEYPLSWKALESLLAVIALVEALVAFLTSVMACKGIALNCRVPTQVGTGPGSTALYMFMQRNDGQNGELPHGVEMRPLVHGRPMSTLETPPAPPPRGSYHAGSRPTSAHLHGIVIDGDDFEPPPAYSEVQQL